MSAMARLLPWSLRHGGHRHGARQLEGRGYLTGDGCDLVGIIRIGGVARLLQRSGEGGDAAAAESGTEARVAAQQRYVVLEALRCARVGAEGGAHCLGGAAGEFLRGGADRRAAPAAPGLDAEEIVARGTVRAARDALAPVALERRLRHESERVHTELLRGLLGLRPYLADEACPLCGRGGRCAGRASGEPRDSRARGARSRAAAGGCATVDGRTLLQLTHQHVGESEALALGELERQLTVVHALVGLRLIGAEDRVLADRVTHALDHHARERADRGGIVAAHAGLELLEPGEIAINGGVVDGGGHQITISSARSEPASFSASRIATRSPGAAPTWFTARTISSRLTPAWNTNMRASVCCTSRLLLGVTMVCPPCDSGVG